MTAVTREIHRGTLRRPSLLIPAIGLAGAAIGFVGAALVTLIRNGQFEANKMALGLLCAGAFVSLRWLVGKMELRLTPEGIELRSMSTVRLAWQEIGLVTALPHLHPRGGAQFPVAVRLRAPKGEVLLDVPDVFDLDRKALAAAILAYRHTRAVSTRPPGPPGAP